MKKSFLLAMIVVGILSNGSLMGKYKLGKPYEVEGKWYYPKENVHYEETGQASWYGDSFHKKLTANGEIFDKNRISAAHPTLPLPSIVKVTNLDNGKSLTVRVNDRGPFVHDRIIDFSEKTARLLGFHKEGTARVKVTFDAAATKKIRPLTLAKVKKLRNYT